MCGGYGICDMFGFIFFCFCDKGWMGWVCEIKCEYGIF